MTPASSSRAVLSARPVTLAVSGRAATGGGAPPPSVSCVSASLQYSPFCGRWRCTWRGSCLCSHPSPRESPGAVESPPPSRLGWGCSLKHRHGRTVSTRVGRWGEGDWPIQSQSSCGQGTNRCQSPAYSASARASGSHGASSSVPPQVAVRPLRRQCRVTGKTHARAPFFSNQRHSPGEKSENFPHAISPSNPEVSANYKPWAKSGLWSGFV